MNITGIIAVITGITSVMAFNNLKLFEELIFWPYRIWRNNEWYRLVSSGFIHADVGHLLFNMISFYSFGVMVENEFTGIFHGAGLTVYVVMYFTAIAFADIYHLFTQKDNFNYRALGASGGVSAVIFASILLNPYGQIGLIFIPNYGIPAFVFGPLYLFYCAYMAKRGGDNIGHTAHFTGAVYGFVFPAIFSPGLLLEFMQHLVSRH